ncbi:MAG: hypothetical protein GYA39_05685 [Methanothrix sp.]|nr:hypothetical protein [Methanothrix sp.]
MASVLKQLIRPQKKAMHRSELEAMELQMAKEILAEVFRVRLSEVDEMIENRFQAGEERCSREWPQELWVDGEAVASNMPKGS